MKDDRPIQQLVEDLWDKNEKVREGAIYDIIVVFPKPRTL
jgi:hypothetical protein